MRRDINFVATWEPKTESLYKKADAQKVAEEIYELGDKVEVDEILDMARDPSKEIHKLIEWDDEIAAENYRREQVRSVTRHLQIVEIGIGKNKKPEKIGVPLRLYHNLCGETGYRPLPKIILDDTLHNQLLMTARAELNAFMIKYSTLEELYPIFKAIRELPPDAA